MFKKEITPHLAELSKLRFTEKELEKMGIEMESIVALMDTLSDFNAEGDFASTKAKSLSDFREDLSDNSMKRSEMLKNSVDKKGTFFKVPKVV